MELSTDTLVTPHHAVFDEAWYLQPSRPPGPQLLYDLGLTEESDLEDDMVPPSPDMASYPPCPVTDKPPPKLARHAIHRVLPLRMTEAPRSVAARAAKLKSET